MVKTYLRYRQDAVLGVVASSGGAIDVSSEPDAAGNVLLFTPQLERLGMWSLGRGVQLHSFDAGGTGASGAAASVTCTRASPGTAPTVAAGYDDGAVRTFDCVKLAPRAVFHGHKKAVSALCYSPDGQLLASGSRDTSIVLWDLLAETGVCRFRGHRDEVTSVAFVSLHGGSSAGGRGRLLLVSGSKDTLVKVWDLSVRSCLQTIVGARTEVWSLAVTPQHDRLLVGTSDQQLLVWRVGDEAGAAKTAAAGDGAKDGAAPPAAASTAVFHPMGSVARQTHDRVASVRCSADGAHAGIQCAGKSIEVLRRRTPAEAAKRLQRRLRRHREKLGKKSRKAAADAGGSDDDDGGAESLDLVGTSLADIDALLAQLDGGDAAATGPRGGDGAKAGPVDWVVASDEWELVGVVQAAQRVSAFAFLPPPGRVSASVAVAGGAAPPLQLAVALHSNVVEVHSLVPLEPDAPPPAPGSLHVATTAAGVTVAQSSVLRTIGGLQGHRADVRAVAVSPDGSLLLSVAGAQARVWNAKSGACIRTLSLGEASAVGLCAAFAPGARHALIGLKTGRLLVFDLASTDLIESHDAHTAALWSVAVRPDGRGCATGGADKEVKFWDFDLTAAAPVGAGVAGGTAKPAAAASGGAKQLTLVHTRTLKLTDEVLTVRYSHHADPAQLLLAAALLDATVRVFFDDTLKFFLSLYGHKLPVLTMDISADSTLLITGSADKNVKVRGAAACCQAPLLPLTSPPRPPPPPPHPLPQIWGLDFGDCHKSFLAHGDSVMAVAFLSRTHYFFSAGKDRAIKYWDADRFEHILTLEGHKGEVWGLAAAPDGAFVVSASHDRSLRVWVRTDEQASGPLGGGRPSLLWRPHTPSLRLSAPLPRSSWMRSASASSTGCSRAS